MQRITVINKIPRTMLDVMENQFKLMHGWMAPLTQLAESQHAELRQLKDLVETCMTEYGDLIQGLAAARKKKSKSDK